MRYAFRRPTVFCGLLLVLACASRPLPAATAPIPPAAETQTAGVLPLTEGSVRFAVIGDTGNGDRPQYQIGSKLAELRRTFPFEFIVMLGDNMYGSERPRIM